MSIEPYLHPVVETYIRAVTWVRDMTGFEDRLLHVHVGLLIFLLARLITRRPFSSPALLGWVFAAEAINEIFDRLHYGRWMPDTIEDVIYTMFWPVMIFAIDRFRSARSGNRARRR